MKNVNILFNKFAKGYSLNFGSGEDIVVEEIDADELNIYYFSKVMLVKQDGDFYLFGLVRDTDWIGFIVHIDVYNKYKDKFRLFNNLYYRVTI